MNSLRGDHDPVYVAQPDWWSRIVAVGSLVVAGAALYWVYLRDSQQSPRNIDQTAQIKTAVADGVQTIRDEGGRERQQLDAYLTTALTKIDQHVTARMAEPSPSQVPNTEFEEPIASPSTSSPQNQTTPSQRDGLSATPDDPALTLPRADLLEVYAVLRVDDLESRPTLIVRNRGTAAARITHVRFEPTNDFGEVPLSVAAMRVGSSTADRLVVRFNKADNLAANPEMHGAYEQLLSTPFEIAADQEIEVQIVIANREHRGFGLKGRCVLLEGGTEIASFENIAVPFITGS